MTAITSTRRDAFATQRDIRPACLHARAHVTNQTSLQKERHVSGIFYGLGRRGKCNVRFRALNSPPFLSSGRGTGALLREARKQPGTDTYVRNVAAAAARWQRRAIRETTTTAAVLVAAAAAPFLTPPDGGRQIELSWGTGGVPPLNTN